MEINVYIAAPFFNNDQLLMVKKIEEILDTLEIKYFSPRSEGTISSMNESEREIHIRKIYHSNIYNMINCNMMIAVIDNYDTGTIFELGYFNSLKDNNKPEKSIITLTGENHNLNVMLKFGVDCHLKSSEDMRLLLTDIKGGLKMENVFSYYNLNTRVET